MITTRSINKVRKIIKKAKSKKKIVGFVPTMGALHLGHLSLIREAKKECDFVVVSIFVNPIQFGPHEDYRRYPRNFKEDKKILEEEKVDLLFLPSVKAMYPENFSTYVEEVSLSKYLCGRFRPGHFRGVTTVVTKLFNIVMPDISYFGQKDFQQAQIIKRMVRDLNFSIKIKVLPIIREEDGLAMSSRNSYLTYSEREKAKFLYRSLKKAEKMIKKGEKDAGKIKRRMIEFIKEKIPESKIDYVEIVSPFALENLNTLKKNQKVLIALAVHLGGARLIDNILVRV